MTERIRRDWDVEALEVAAGWPGADRSTLVTLATGLQRGVPMPRGTGSSKGWRTRARVSPCGRRWPGFSRSASAMRWRLG